MMNVSELRLQHGGGSVYVDISDGVHSLRAYFRRVRSTNAVTCAGLHGWPPPGDWLSRANAIAHRVRDGRLAQIEAMLPLRA
jgi:hypothetical protein